MYPGDEGAAILTCDKWSGMSLTFSKFRQWQDSVLPSYPMTRALFVRKQCGEY